MDSIDEQDQFTITKLIVQIRKLMVEIKDMDSRLDILEGKMNAMELNIDYLYYDRLKEVNNNISSIEAKVKLNSFILKTMFGKK